MPATTRSGSRSKSPVMARWTQSVGVPFTRMEPRSVRIARRGMSSVKELLAPLRSRSGATTATSAIDSKAATRANSPGD